MRVNKQSGFWVLLLDPPSRPMHSSSAAENMGLMFTDVSKLGIALSSRDLPPRGLPVTYDQTMTEYKGSTPLSQLETC